MKNILHYISTGLTYAMLPFVAIIALVMWLIDVMAKYFWKFLCLVVPGIILSLVVIYLFNSTCDSFQESTGRVFIQVFGIPGIHDYQDLDINDVNPTSCIMLQTKEPQQ